MADGRLVTYVTGSCCIFIFYVLWLKFMVLQVWVNVLVTEFKPLMGSLFVVYIASY